MEVPETRYVERPDGVSIAYQVFGSGRRDIVFIPGFISHLDLQWTEPRFVAMLRWMGGLGRVVTFDKPGVGLSDPLAYVPTLEERAEDVRIVMDAAGVERATVMGFSEGTSSALMLAATRPERVERLILYGSVIVGDPSDEMLAHFGMTREEADRRWTRFETVVSQWGSGRTIDLLCPSVSGPVERRLWGLFERAAASPKLAKGLIDTVRLMNVIPLLSSVQVPALVVHNVDDFAPVANGRYLAEALPQADYREMPGADHAFWLANPSPVMAEVERFLDGVAAAPATPDRVLATILFTDVVGSTQRAAELGDAAWRQELERHEALVRREVGAERGRVVKSMGDGHLAVFDGPARAIRCARAMLAASELPLRAGVHTGECEAIGDDLGGLAVHIGARVGSLASAGEVLVSNTVKDLVVGSGFPFADRGEHELKGVPGRWRLHAVTDTAERPRIEPERELRPGDRLALRMANRAPHRMHRVASAALRLKRA